MSDNPNMVRYISKLDVNDKAVICAAVRTHSSMFPDAHPGMLPFMPVTVVVACVKLSYQEKYNAQQHTRTHATLLSKLEAHKWTQHTVERYKTSVMLRKLDDGLVAKRFGIHPERGVPIPGFQAVVKRPRDRKMFEKAADAYDNEHPMMTLKKLADGFWQISCPEKYRHYVDTWLLDFCTK